MHVRVYQDADAPELVELYSASVRSIGPKDYSTEQVEAWLSLAPSVEAMRARCRDGRTVLLAVGDNGRPLAFGDIEADGHIGYFYCAPEHAGSGTALEVYGALERHARGSGLARMYVEASEAARRFFLRRGFAVIERRDFQINSVLIHNFSMEKDLVEV
ncbi:MAG TPA: GNAT family N-acetyltransferase [Microvirga sp.]|nr:GNAT family N-acetyltransferase [Microvirga sp.]